MKNKILSTLFCLFMLSFSTLAENYPYRTDYLWVTTPDHTDWLYKTGEKADIEVSFYIYGIPQDGNITYTIADDMLTPDTNGKATLKNGRTHINIGTRKTPGFRDLVVKYERGGMEYTHHIKVGFSVDKIEPYTQEPSDFMSFWNKEIEMMHSSKLSYTRELAPEYCTDKIDCWIIKLQVDKQKHCIYGYLTMPKDAKAGKHPIVLCPPGAGVKTIKEPLRHKYYAENGFIRMEMEIHGLDPRLPKQTFDEISYAFNNHENGYLQYGLDNRENYYMRHVYLSLIRSIDLLTSLPEWDGHNVIMQGGSQGGALSMVAAGLDTRVTQCVVNHPALTDMAAYIEKGRTGGYPHFNKMNGMLTEQTIHTLQYYDVINFARHISCPVFMTWGYNDPTCPPTTSYAAWNILTCPKESLITPVNEHWTSDATEYRQMEWIRERLK